MNLTKKQAEFWVALLVLCLIVAIAITLVDFSIKAAILRESNALRLKIEAWEVANGRGSQEAIADGVDANSVDNPSVSIPILVDESTRMEAADVPDGTEVTNQAADSNGSKPRGSARPRGVSARDKQV